MAQRYEIRLSGAGGQGLILAGIILAEAAGIYDGKFVCQTQSYGPAARGGASKAEVVISDEEIDYPKALRPDVFLAMNKRSLDVYLKDLKPEGLLIVDSSVVRDCPRAICIPFTQIARQQVGKEITANLVALAALVTLTRVVSLKSLEAAVLQRVPPGTADLNKKALRAGVKAAKQFMQERKMEFLPAEGSGDNES